MPEEISPFEGTIRLTSRTLEDLPNFDSTAEATDYYRPTKLSMPNSGGYVCFDIETGENPRSELFKPKFKQPKITSPDTNISSNVNIISKYIPKKSNPSSLTILLS